MLASPAYSFHSAVIPTVFKFDSSPLLFASQEPTIYSQIHDTHATRQKAKGRQNSEGKLLKFASIGWLRKYFFKANELSK